MVSNTKKTKVCDHPRYIQTYCWKKKLAVLMLPRFQGSLQRTKTLILKPGKRFTGIYRSTFTKATMLVTHCILIFQNFLNFEQLLVLKTWWECKFYYCFKLRAIYTFYSCSSAVSNKCHILKTCLQSRGLFVFGSKFDYPASRRFLQRQTRETTASNRSFF